MATRILNQVSLVGVDGGVQAFELAHTGNRSQDCTLSRKWQFEPFLHCVIRGVTQNVVVLNLRKTAALLLALLALTGCPTPPKSKPKITPIEIQTFSTEPAPKGRDVLTETNEPPPTAPSPAIPSASVTPRIDRIRDEWVSWATWSQTNGYEKPHQVKGNPHLAYESQSPASVVTLVIGSRVAYWNGLSLGLGFGPRFTNGQPVVNALDIAKNFAPLTKLPAALQKTTRVVVIDPGHGGENTGAKCVLNGRCEKDYTLDWALRIQPLLMANGWTVFLTRTKDIDLSLSSRVAFADKVQADLFISLHFNSVESQSARLDHGGVETYCLTPVGMPSNLTRDYEDDPALVFPNNTFDAQNLQYAIRLHRALLQSTGRKDRGLRRARFMTVLQGQKRPAVLLEGGYISNSEEARLITNADYRQKLAQAVATALSE